MSTYKDRYNKLYFFFDNLPASVSLIDEDCRYLFVNNDFHKSFLSDDQPKERVLGKRNDVFFSHNIASRLDSNNYSVLKLGDTRCYEEVVEGKNGENQFWLSMKKPVFSSNGDAKLVITVSLNITERKKIEEKLGLNFLDDDNKPLLSYVYDSNQYSYFDQGSKLFSTDLCEFINELSFIQFFNNLDLGNELHAKLAVDFFETTLFNFPANIYVKDHEFRIKFVNANLARDISLSSPEEAIGKTLFDLIPMDVAQSLTDLDRILLSTDDTSFYEEPIVLDDSPRFYLSYKRSVYDPSTGHKLILGASVDYTIQKQLEINFRQALAKQSLDQEAKEIFVTNISHDIRTPITGMLGLISEIKSKTNDYPGLQNKVCSLESLTNEFLSLFNGILKSVEDSEEGILTEAVESFNLKKLISSCLSLFKPSLMYKDVYLSVIYNKNFPDSYYGNAGIIKHILINLLGNAVKFTETGEIKLIVNYDSDKKILELVVSDTGIGINQSDHAKIFERFTRLDLSPNSRYQGAGLGLYMVKKYVDALKGKISLRSRLGLGATFSVKLPFLMAEADKNKPLEIKDDGNHAVAKELEISVLIVEDNVLAARAFKHIVESTGVVVTIAESGAEALKLVAENSYQIIFLDLGLPDLSGIDVLTSLKRNLNTENANIYILSGHVTREIDEQCIRAGASGTYTKPMMLEQVKDILKVINK